MIRKIEDLNFYELLEVSPTATSQEIHKAYERVRRVYEPNSIALYSLFTPEETAAIHQRIEEAYRTLVYEDSRKIYDTMLKDRDDLLEPPLPPLSAPKYQEPTVKPTPTLNSENRYPGVAAATSSQLSPEPPTPAQKEVSPVSSFISEFTGPAIKALREQRGLAIKNIADMTKVSARYLEYIEEEQFAKLPARAYVRGFLTLYAKALGYEPERVTGDYLKRYDAATGFPHALRKKSQG